MDGTGKVLIAMGLTLALLGGLGVAGYGPFPAAIYNSFSITAPVVTCTITGYTSSGRGISDCIGSVTITNNNATQASVIWWYFFPTTNDGLGENSGSIVQAITSTVGSTQTFTQDLGYVNCGSYTLQAEVNSANNQNLHLSPSPFMYFTSCYYFAVGTSNYVNAFTYQVSPTPSSQVFFPGYTGLSGAAYVPATSLTVTGVPNSGLFLTCWQYVVPSTGGCPTANPYTFVLNQNTYINPQLSLSPGGQFSITVNPYVGPNVGSVTPSTGQNLLSGGSATFTAIPAGPYQFNSWQLVGTTTISLGSANPVTVTYAQASSVIGGGTQGQVSLVANFGYKPIVQVLDNIQNPGKVTLSGHNSMAITIPGTTSVPVGTQITVTASNVVAGYTWGGWTQDGNVVTQSMTYTFTVSTSTTLMPNIIRNNLVGCYAPGTTVTITCTITVIGSSTGSSCNGGVCTTTITSSTITTASTTVCTITQTQTTNWIIIKVTNTVTTTTVVNVPPGCASPGPGLNSILDYGLIIIGISTAAYGSIRRRAS